MKVSIFLITDTGAGVGGAEKRIFGLWLNLQKRGAGFRLVTYQKMLDLLAATGEFAGFEQYRKNIEIIARPKGGIVEKSRLLRLFVTEKLSPGELLHFTMYFPLLLRLPNPVVFTDPISNAAHYGWRGKLVNYARILLADRTDVLDPRRGLDFQRKLFWKRGKIHVTSNTFVDPNRFQALAMSEKNDWLVFLGRFEPVKQVIGFARAIPAIYRVMLDQGIERPKFFILGHGALEDELRKVLDRTEFAGIDVEARYEPQPADILARAKVFFSLQKFTNFPSKSLAEALAAGCLPIVTDNGETRRLARPAFSFYVPEDFTDDMLAARVRDVYTLSDEAQQAKSSAAREFAAAELSIEKMTDYYLELYSAAVPGT